MKKLFYRLYALFFNLFRILLPLKSNRVAFVAPHNGGEHDSLGVMKKYVEALGKYETVSVSTRDLKISGFPSVFKAISFFTSGAAKLAKSKYVFLNDNFMPMAGMNFSPEATVIMLWHAEGAFKKFGLSAPLSDDIIRTEKACSKRLDYIICSSKKVAPIYAEAFGTDIAKILPLGSPRVDELLAQCNCSAMRSRFDERHPECRNKKLILYAPTFRDAPEKDCALLSHIDANKFSEELGDEYQLLIKLHPQINSASPVEKTTDVTNEDIGMLTHICDMVITDYSSVCMDFALLSKPCIFFAFDLEEYEKERSFYFDYESYVPGRVAKTFDEVIKAIKNPQSLEDSLQRFRNFNFDYFDCDNTKRIFDAVVAEKS